MEKTTSILVYKQPTGKLRAKNVWHVSRIHKEDVDMGFLGRVLGRGTRHEHLETFDSREEAIDYARQEAEPEERITAELVRSAGQTTVEAEGP
jgi:hypothetical protein